MPVSLTNPPSQEAPQGVTPSAPLNLGMGMATVAATSAGSTWAAQDPFVIVVGAILNLAAQPIKYFRRLDQNKWLGLILLALALVGCIGLVDVLFDHSIKAAISNAALGTLKAMADYKADKLAGTNILKPTPPELSPRGD